MFELDGSALQRKEVVEVTVHGLLASPRHRATLRNGGEPVEPGVASVHLEETIEPGPILVGMAVPWLDQIRLREGDWRRVIVQVKNREALELPVLPLSTTWKVVAYGRASQGQHAGASVIPAEAQTPSFAHDVFGPASRDDCDAWAFTTCNVSG